MSTHYQSMHTLPTFVKVVIIFGHTMKCYQMQGKGEITLGTSSYEFLAAVYEECSEVEFHSFIAHFFRDRHWITNSEMNLIDKTKFIQGLPVRVKRRDLQY